MPRLPNRSEKYFTKYSPVPGIPMDKKRYPLAATPIRNPGMPQLYPTPARDHHHRSGPSRKTFRNLQPISILPLAAEHPHQVTAKGQWSVCS